jgi:hypothetical protein
MRSHRPDKSVSKDYLIRTKRDTTKKLQRPIGIETFNQHGITELKITFTHAQGNTILSQLMHPFSLKLRFDGGTSFAKTLKEMEV